MIKKRAYQPSPTFCIRVKSYQYGITTDTNNAGTEQNLQDPLTIHATFTLPSTYPVTTPEVSLSSSGLTREATQRLRIDLLEYAKTLESEPMVMELVDWLKEQGSKYVTVVESGGDEKATVSEEIKVAVLHVDHMRSKAKYVKTLLKWAEELTLGGRVLFYNNLILILLEGPAEGVKEFIVRLRTQRVDVDSGGHSCKERMMRVIVDQPHPSPQQRHTHFEVTDCTSISTLESTFKAAFLVGIYKEQLIPEFQLLH